MPKRYIVKDYLDCERCGLCHTRRKIVFGRGDIPAELLFVGEGPGVSEDALGLAFVGPSGRLLEQGIAKACVLANLPNPPRYFISNVVGCRPTDYMGGPNRAPTGEEAIACWPRLQRTFADVRPRRIILLGEVARRLCKKTWPDSVCLPHPAYFLRLGGASCPAFLPFCRHLSEVFSWLRK